MNLAQTFANNIKLYRIMACLSQKELAKLLGMHQSNISRLEREEAPVSFSVVEKLAEVLNVPTHEFFRPHRISSE